MCEARAGGLSGVQAMGGAKSVMWNRQFGTEKLSMTQRWSACSLLEGTLRALGAAQLVVGHTPQARPFAAQQHPHRCLPPACVPLCPALHVRCKLKALLWPRRCSCCTCMRGDQTSSKEIWGSWHDSGARPPVLTLKVRTWEPEGLAGVLRRRGGRIASAGGACGAWTSACPRASWTRRPRCACSDTAMPVILTVAAHCPAAHFSGPP